MWPFGLLSIATSRIVEVVNRDDRDPYRLRDHVALPIVGFLVGLAIPGLIAAAAQPFALEWVEAVAIFGMPVGATLGALFSREAVTTARPTTFVPKLALFALLVPGVMIVLMPLALPFVVLLGFPVALLSAAAFTLLMRRLAARTPMRATAVAAVLAVAGVALVVALAP